MRYRFGCYTRSRKHADLMVEAARARLCCSTLRLFLLAFIDDTRQAAKRAYQRYMKNGTLVEKFRNFVYRALHGLVTTLQPA